MEPKHPILSLSSHLFTERSERKIRHTGETVWQTCSRHFNTSNVFMELPLLDGESPGLCRVTHVYMSLNNWRERLDKLKWWEHETITNGGMTESPGWVQGAQTLLKEGWKKVSGKAFQRENRGECPPKWTSIAPSCPPNELQRVNTRLMDGGEDLWKLRNILFTKSTKFFYGLNFFPISEIKNVKKQKQNKRNNTDGKTH